MLLFRNTLRRLPFAALAVSAVLISATGAAWATVANVDDSSFKKEVEEETLPVFIDFYATWCGPCKKVSPAVDDLSVEYKGRVKFVRVDVDKAPKTAEKYSADQLPTLLLRSKKMPKGVYVTGMKTKEELKSFIDDALKKVD
ncbi:MAG: thioredoxin fold domain-containing protein [Cyanobacteria bacterium SZAS LIN-2]|nr:thioredoxin fold domain-containing protein [Cyanobacteria bacterium SZAS LIN-3]MBS1998650.1 thioredoxin fold domain-containing protein [Cyanobacteria bacterium SZAS LIN-2]